MNIIQSFEAKELRKRPLSVRLADDLTSAFGSFSFLLINFFGFAVWILVNMGKIPNVAIFDPFPFPLMTTIVSLEAIVLTLIVLMSQNRQSFISSLREEIDMQVNLTSEREITKILQLLVKVLEKHQIKLDDKELEEMLKHIEVGYLERRLEAQLLQKPKPIIKTVVERVGGVLRSESTSSQEPVSPKD